MSDGWTILLFIIVLVILIFSLVRASAASFSLLSSSNDGNIVIARRYLNYTVIILWTVIALLIIAVIMLFVFGLEFIPYLGSVIFYIILTVLVIALIVVGIMASISAYYIGASTEKDKFGDAYTNSIQAAVASLGSFTLVVVGYALVWYYSGNSEEEYPGDENGYSQV